MELRRCKTCHETYFGTGVLQCVFCGNESEVIEEYDED